MTSTQIDFAVILRHNPSIEILILSNSQLPSVSPERHFWQTCDSVIEAFQETLGLKLIVIRPLQIDYLQISNEETEVRNVYLTRYLEGNIPEDASWKSIDDFLSLGISPSLEENMLSSLNTPPWYSYNWLETILNATQGFTSALGNVQQYGKCLKVTKPCILKVCHHYSNTKFH